MSKSRTTTDTLLTRPEGGWEITASTHPGEMLLAEFMEPLGLSINRLADELDVAVSRLHDLVRARRGVTADTALRLSQRFGTTAEFWLNLQNAYDLAEARKTKPRVKVLFGSTIVQERKFATARPAKQPKTPRSAMGA